MTTTKSKKKAKNTVEKKLVLRLDPDLYRELEEEAERQERSINSEIVHSIKLKLKKV